MQKGRVVCRAEGQRRFSCRRAELFVVQKGRDVCRAEGQSGKADTFVVQKGRDVCRAEGQGKRAELFVVQKGRAEGQKVLLCRRAEQTGRVICRAEGHSFVMQTPSLFCPTCFGRCCFMHQFLSYTKSKHCRSKYVYQNYVS